MPGTRSFGKRLFSDLPRFRQWCWRAEYIVAIIDARGTWSNLEANAIRVCRLQHSSTSDQIICGCKGNVRIVDSTCHHLETIVGGSRFSVLHMIVCWAWIRHTVFTLRLRSFSVLKVILSARRRQRLRNRKTFASGCGTPRGHMIARQLRRMLRRKASTFAVGLSLTN